MTGKRGIRIFCSPVKSSQADGFMSRMHISAEDNIPKYTDLEIYYRKSGVEWRLMLILVSGGRKSTLFYRS